jgi:hypothetical protein
MQDQHPPSRAPLGGGRVEHPDGKRRRWRTYGYAERVIDTDSRQFWCIGIRSERVSTPIGCVDDRVSQPKDARPMRARPQKEQTA